VDALRRDATVVAVVGSGRQAWAQLWAITAVRSIAEVRLYSPTESHRGRFAARARSELGLEATSTAGARGAVDGADVVILATRSDEPVIDAAWVRPGAHVNTVGPKGVSACETPPELAAAAAIVVSDSPAHAAAYGEPFLTPRQLTHLGAVVCGDVAGRASDSDIILDASTGLAGSEVVIARRLLAR
jgi:alanine dehydrogenase